MRRVRRSPVAAARSALDGPCGCSAHDHPHPAHRKADTCRPDGTMYPRDERPDLLAALAAGCTTCEIVAGGTYESYLRRMGR